MISNVLPQTCEIWRTVASDDKDKFGKVMEVPQIVITCLLCRIDTTRYRPREETAILNPTILREIDDIVMIYTDLTTVEITSDMRIVVDNMWYEIVFPHKVYGFDDEHHWEIECKSVYDN